MSAATEILGRIEEDPVFRGFLEPGFDPAAFASNIVKADVGKAGVGPPMLQLQGGGAVLSGGGVNGGDGVSGGSGSGAAGGMVASAETVSSQAEITLDVSCSTPCTIRAIEFVLGTLNTCTAIIIPYLLYTVFLEF